MEQYIQVVIELLLEVAAILGSDGSAQQDLLGVAAVAFGTGAALLHPIIWAMRGMLAGTVKVATFPGEVIRARHHRKYLEEKEKREQKKMLSSLSKQVREQKKQLAAFTGTVKAAVVLDDTDELDLELLDLDEDIEDLDF